MKNLLVSSFMLSLATGILLGCKPNSKNFEELKITAGISDGQTIFCSAIDVTVIKGGTAVEQIPLKEGLVEISRVNDELLATQFDTKKPREFSNVKHMKTETNGKSFFSQFSKQTDSSKYYVSVLHNLNSKGGGDLLPVVVVQQTVLGLGSEFRYRYSCSFGD